MEAELVRDVIKTCALDDFRVDRCNPESDRLTACWLRFDADPIVYPFANSLFAAEITFKCLDRDVAEQELDLLQRA